MNQLFSIEESLRFGWQKTKEHSGVIFKALLTLFAVQIASSVVSTVLKGTIQGTFASILFIFVSLFIGVGFLQITLKMAEGHAVKYADIWPQGKLVWEYFLASLLSGVIIMFGFILLIVPGVYFALRYSMVRYAIIDGASVTDSLRKSAAMTYGLKWRLLGFFLVLVLINILGAMLLMVGLLITVPVSSIAYAHVYLKLKHHHVENKA